MYQFSSQRSESKTLVLVGIHWDSFITSFCAETRRIHILLSSVPFKFSLYLPHPAPTTIMTHHLSSSYCGGRGAKVGEWVCNIPKINNFMCNRYQWFGRKYYIKVVKIPLILFLCSIPKLVALDFEIIEVKF